VLLGKREDVSRRLSAGVDSPAARGYRRLIGKLARAYRHLTGRDPGTPESFLQFVVDASARPPTAGRRRGRESQAGAPSTFAP
jgi:hypothetical protein